MGQETVINSHKIAIFGTTLFHQYKEQPRNAKTEIPDWLQKLCEFLYDGLSNGSIGWDKMASRPTLTMHEVQAIYTQLCSYSTVTWDVRTAPAFLQFFLEQVPDPILTFDLHAQWLTLARDIWVSEEQRIQFLRLLLSLLPEINRLTLKHLMPIFATVCSQDPERQKSLSYFWGPLLLLRRGTHEYDLQVAESAGLFSILVSNLTEIKEVRTPQAPPSPVPQWLSELTQKKRSLVTDVKQKLANRTVKYFQKVCQRVKGEPSVEEFFWILDYMDTQLTILETKLDDTQVFDTYHVNRYSRFLSDLDETMQSHGPKKSVTDANENLKCEKRQLLYFNHARFRWRLFQLIMAMLQELVLFAESVYHVKHLSDNEKHQISLKVSNSFNGVNFTNQGYMWWINKFGIDKVAVRWEVFLEEVKEAAGEELSEKAIEGLKHLVDPNDTNFVTSWRVARSIFKFWCKQDYGKTLRSCLLTVEQDYFHPYITKEEIKFFFDKLPLGKFLVRFSASVVGFAIHWKVPDNQEKAAIVNLFPDLFSYQIYEDNGTQPVYFEELPAIIDYYRGKTNNGMQILGEPYAEKMYKKPYFYGFLETDDTLYFLKEQPKNIFLVRFSTTFADQLVISFAAGDMDNNSTPVRHMRVERTPSGHIIFQNYDHPDLDTFLIHHQFIKPYKDTVSCLFEEDEQWCEQWSFSSKIGNSSGGAGHMGISGMSGGSVQSGLGGKQQRFEELELLFVDHAQVGPEPSFTEDLESMLNFTSIERAKQIHFVVLGAKHSNVEEVISKKASRKFFPRPWILKKDSLIENTLHRFPITIENTDSQPLHFSVEDCGTLDRRYFFSVARGKFGEENLQDVVVEPGKQVTIDVVIVIYQPFDLKRVVSVTCNFGKVSEVFHIPVWLTSSPKSLFGHVSAPPVWRVEEEFLTKPNPISSGSGVTRCSLFNVAVVSKRWHLKPSEKEKPSAYVRELAILREIKHANLVTFVGAFESSMLCMVVMEFCTNGNLTDFLEKTDPDKMSDEDRVKLALDICNVMNHIHSLNKMHRDLKPDNLLVDASLRIKLADFGIARNDSAYTVTYQAGSPNWMAPEQINLIDIYTNKVDVFPFALIVLQLCEHKPTARVLANIMAGWCSTLPREWVERIPIFSEVMDKCSQKNPAKRPSYRQLANMLTLSLQKMKDKKSKRKKLNM